MDRLTIGEVINHCERTVEESEKIFRIMHDGGEFGQIESKAYWEHKQTAEWLKELKRYKDLAEAGRLVELPKEFDEKKLFRVLSYSGCPNAFGLPKAAKCPVIPCGKCWEAALKGEKNE